MDHVTTAVAPCAECGRPAEPPFTPLYTLFGRRVRWVVCLDCAADILRPGPAPGENDHDLGGEGG